ncbi:hypothetical protein GXM_06927 [Nostoc sphaeroides CCNUC1]|uniref:Uncharacterized protein n=1 Tax=Nostoc sphaeroides CCNUC1 TaxID=2653204 RepID=A0A5P8W9G7_9NOSO|nr:hypothetical protein GXM_06927 [Nostoc sphaeroides CCNUC1]
MEFVSLFCASGALAKGFGKAIALIPIQLMIATHPWGKTR